MQETHELACVGSTWGAAVAEPEALVLVLYVLFSSGKTFILKCFNVSNMRSLSVANSLL